MDHRKTIKTSHEKMPRTILLQKTLESLTSTSAEEYKSLR